MQELHINCGINDYMREAEKRDFAPGHVRRYLNVASKKHFCVTLLSHTNCRDSCSRGWGFVPRKLKTAFPKGMRAGVMIGETLSSEVEINMINQAINSISTTSFVQNTA